MKAVHQDGEFLDNLLGDEEVGRYLTADEVRSCFDVGAALARAGTIFERLEALKVEP